MVARRGAPVPTSNGPHVVQALLVVGLGRAVAAALDRVDVDDHRPGGPGGPAERRLEVGDPVAVDRPVVREAEGAEEGGRPVAARRPGRDTVGA